MSLTAKSQVTDNSGKLAQTTQPGNNKPVGTCLAILSFSPTTASAGDTVTIQLFVPCRVDSVSFGGVPALSIVGTPQYNAIVKAVVANGSSGAVQVKNSDAYDFDNKDGFTYVPRSALIKPVNLCPPAAGAVLHSELANTNFRWQVSIDSSNFTDITNNANYDGATTTNLVLRDIPSNWSGRRYRCLSQVDTSRTFKLIFQNEFFANYNTSWQDSRNWSCGLLPDENTDVILRGPTVLSADFAVKSLTLLPGSSFNVAAGIRLTILH